MGGCEGRGFDIHWRSYIVCYLFVFFDLFLGLIFLSISNKRMRDICRSERGVFCCRGDTDCMATLEGDDEDDDEISPTTAIPAVVGGKYAFEKS